MTNLEKQELRAYARRGLTFEQIRKLVSCSDKTIKVYLKALAPKPMTLTNSELDDLIADVVPVHLQEKFTALLEKQVTEARINELKRLRRRFNGTDYEKLRNYINHRIATLKDTLEGKQ